MGAGSLQEPLVGSRSIPEDGSGSTDQTTQKGGTTETGTFANRPIQEHKPGPVLDHLDAQRYNTEEAKPINNPLYLSAVTIVAIIAITIISLSDSANSSAVIGLLALATAAAGGMAGVARQPTND